MKLELSPRQWTTITTALTVLAVAVIIAAVMVLVVLFAGFVGAFQNVFLPLAVAAVIALVLKPIYDWLLGRLRHPVPALLVLFVGSLIPLLAVGWFFGSILSDQISGLITKGPELWTAAVEEGKERWPLVKDLWERYGDQITEFTAARQQELMRSLRSLGAGLLSAGVSFFGLLATLAAWAVLPVYVAFFLLMDPEEPGKWPDRILPFLKAETRKDIAYLVTEFVNIIVSFFRGQLLIALLQGLLFGLGFTLAGLRYGAVLGLILGFLNIIPYLGSIVGLAAALPLALFQPNGGLGTLLGVIIVFTVVQTIEGYLLTPKIMGDRTGLHPMVIMVAIFFWGTALGGIIGMLLAIPLTAFFVVLWRLVREKYIRELL